MRETVIEKYLREQVMARGGLCEKHTSPGTRGVPDRLVTWYCLMDLIETKRPGGTVKKHQQRDHERRRRRGVEVFVLSTKEQVDEYVEFRRVFWPKSPQSSM